MTSRDYETQNRQTSIGIVAFVGSKWRAGAQALARRGLRLMFIISSQISLGFRFLTQKNSRNKNSLGVSSDMPGYPSHMQ